MVGCSRGALVVHCSVQVISSVVAWGHITAQLAALFFGWVSFTAACGYVESSLDGYSVTTSVCYWSLGNVHHAHCLIRFGCVSFTSTRGVILDL